MEIMQQSYDETHLTYLESAPIGVVVVEETGEIARVNARAEEIFGYSRQELIGRSMETLLPRRFRHIHHMHRNDYFESSRSRPMGVGLELSGLRKDGTEFPVEVGLSHIQLGGRNLAMAFITDITVRVQAAEALRRHASELEQRVAERTREIERRRQVAEGLHDILTILNTARPLEEILDLRSNSCDLRRNRQDCNCHQRYSYNPQFANPHRGSIHRRNAYRIIACDSIVKKQNSESQTRTLSARFRRWYCSLRRTGANGIPMWDRAETRVLRQDGALRSG